MSKTKYSVVSCQFHSELELIIMHKQAIRLQLAERNIVAKPLDILTRKDSGEFLLVRDESGEQQEIRLDQIKSWNATIS